MMESMYEVAPGCWLMNSVSMAEHQAAMAGNYEPDWPDEDGIDEHIWITKDGRVMYIEDMTDSHLRNAIAYLRRKGVNILAEAPVLWEEYRCRLVKRSSITGTLLSGADMEEG